jgi:hypothetical protein
MKDKLSDFQREQLAEFSGLNRDDLDFLFKNIEYQLENSYLPTKGSKKVKALEVAVLCDDISKASLMLNKLLKELPKLEINIMDGSLGSEFLTPYQHKSIKIGGEPAMFTDRIDAIKAVDIISSEALSTSHYNRNNYGSRYLEPMIIGLHMAWGHSFYNRPIKVTLESDYVTFFCIIFDEYSREAIHKQLLRSKWYKTQTNHLVK